MSLGAVRRWEKSFSQGPKPDNLTVFAVSPKTFIPTYEKTALRPDIKLIMSMEYRRMWFEERGRYQRHVYPPADKSCIVRKHLVKDAWKKTKACLNAPPPPLLKSKRYANVPAKVDTGLGELASQLIPQCPKCHEFHAALEKCVATKLCDVQKVKNIALKSK